MKYKNYRNPYTNDNRIYSKSDISNMRVRDVFNKAKEILGQNRKIGIPSHNELKASSNTIWIDEYTREDGTKVCGHWRSKPDGNCIEGIDGETSKFDSKRDRDKEREYTSNFR